LVLGAADYRVLPERIWWWNDASAMNEAPQVWQAPSGTEFPASDAAPCGKSSPPSPWPQRPWQELALDAFRAGAPGHLTMCDAQGFPLPVPTTEVTLAGDLFRMKVGRGLPLAGSGQATLSFRGKQTFVGVAEIRRGEACLQVERALPQLPTMVEHSQVMRPSPTIRASLMARLEEEVGRRGQPIPAMPEQLPPPTRMAILRKQRLIEILSARGLEHLEL